MNVYEEYQKKLTTPQQAVQCIQSGDWVDYGVCAGHPVALDRALAQRGAELHDVKIRGMNALWLPEIAKIPDAAQHFCWNSWAMMGRRAQNAEARHVLLRAAALLGAAALLPRKP